MYSLSLVFIRGSTTVLMSSENGPNINMVKHETTMHNISKLIVASRLL